MVFLRFILARSPFTKKHRRVLAGAQVLLWGGRYHCQRPDALECGEDAEAGRVREGGGWVGFADLVLLKVIFYLGLTNCSRVLKQIQADV